PGVIAWSDKRQQVAIGWLPLALHFGFGGQGQFANLRFGVVAKGVEANQVIAKQLLVVGNQLLAFNLACNRQNFFIWPVGLLNQAAAMTKHLLIRRRLFGIGEIEQIAILHLREFLFADVKIHKSIQQLVQ